MKENMQKDKNMTADQNTEDNKIMTNTNKNNAMTTEIMKREGENTVMHKTANTTTGSMKKGFAKRAALLGLLSVMTVSSVMPAMAATTAGTGTASGTTVSTESVSDQTLTVTTYTTTTVAQVENINLQINSNTSFYMSWNSVSGAAGYEVWRCASGGEWVMIRDNAKTSHIGGAQLTSGVKYYFRVRAYKTVNGKKVYGAWSSQVSVVYGTPAAPKNLKVSAESSNSNLTLSWTLYGSASKFVIERKVSGGSWTVLGTVSGSVKTYTDKTATSGTKYYYRVRAYNTVGSSTLYGAYSDEVSCTAAGTVTVKSVSGVKISYQMNDKQSVISWKKVSGASGYEVYRQKEGSSKWTLAGTTTKTKYADSGLSANETYRYKVRAYKKSGSSKVCGSYSSVKKIKAVYCTGASNLEAFNSNGKKAVISWDSSASNPETTTFTVYRKANGSSKWTKIKETKSTKVYDTSAAKGIKYTYKVQTTIKGNGKTYTAKKSPTATVVLKTYSKQHYYGKVSVLGRSGNVYTLGAYTYLTGYGAQDVIDAANSVLLSETNDGTLLFSDHSDQVFRSLWSVKKGSTATVKTKYGTTKLKCVRVYYRNKNDAFYSYDYADNEIVMSTCEVGGGSVYGDRVTVWKVTSGPSVKKIKAYYSNLRKKE